MWKQFLKDTWLLLVNSLAVIVALLLLFIYGDNETGEAYVGCVAAIFCAAILLILSISCIGDKMQEVSCWYRILVLLNMILCVTTIVSNLFDEYHGLIEVLYATESILYISTSLLCYFYWYYLMTEIRQEKSGGQSEGKNGNISRLRYMNPLMNSIMLLAVNLIIINRKQGFLFWIDQMGNYHRGVYFPVCWICPFFMMLCCGVVILVQKLRLVWKLVHLSYLVLPLLIYPFQVRHEKMMPLTISVTLSLLLMYCFNYMKRSKTLMQQKEMLAIQQKEMLEMEVQLMISQIQPHFLYNTIAMIRGLCREEPERAADALGYFSAFLRGSLHMMQEKECISIQQELNLVEAYMTLEQMRFGERLEYIEDIEDVEFKIPALTIEPLLENAVHHGIEEKEEGGMVLLEVAEEEKQYIIRITDNGTGVDVNAPVDTKKHIGMANVKERLQKMCGGTLEFESVIGEGTAAIIRIPKGGSSQ
ncbi:MAG: histidine kinase [Lachnospiraceae bacterium]|nr:histidine kinase [Lachnospiraceae bacterium]